MMIRVYHYQVLGAINALDGVGGIMNMDIDLLRT